MTENDKTKPESPYRELSRRLIEESKRARETDPQKWGAMVPDPQWGELDQ